MKETYQMPKLEIVKMEISDMVFTSSNELEETPLYLEESLDI